MKKRIAHNRVEVDIDKLKKLYSDEGYPVTQISKIMNLSVDSLRNRIKEYQLPKPKKKKPRESNNIIELDEKEIIRLYCKDLLTIQEICKKFNVNYGTIKLRLQQNNIKIRNASESKKLFMNRPEIKKKMTKINNLIKKSGKKSHRWKGGYALKNIPMYDTYAKQLSYADDCRRNPFDRNILEVKCTYCGRWFTPTRSNVYDRVRALEGKQLGEQRLYCSNECKEACPIFGKILYPKGFQKETSREVQPELRQMRFKLDNYTCQKCKKHQDELLVGLHCHHIEGIRWEPLESADIDKCITYCKDCHLEVHRIEGCGYHDMQCK